MKIRCRYCRRLIRVMNTRAPVPRLVKHLLPAEKCHAEHVPQKTPCYGSLTAVAIHTRPEPYGVTA